MGIKTKEEYIESIRALKPTVYMFGEKLTTSVVDNPRLRAGIEATGATYELANMPENKGPFHYNKSSDQRAGEPFHPAAGQHRGSCSAREDQP